MLETARDTAQNLEFGQLDVLVDTLDVLVGKPANHDIEQYDKIHAQCAQKEPKLLL